jgi:hypothetical protein
VDEEESEALGDPSTERLAALADVEGLDEKNENLPLGLGLVPVPEPDPEPEPDP